MKHGPYVTNLDKYKSIGAHWTVLYVNCHNVTPFDGFRVKYISKYIKKITNNYNITTNIYRIHIHIYRFK